MRLGRALVAAFVGFLFACSGGDPAPPGLTVEQVTAHVRRGTPEAPGWAADVRAAVVAAGRVPDADHVCQVLAIIEQESGYEADPEVPELGRIVAEQLDEQLARLGPLSGVGRDVLLDQRPEGEALTFAERIPKLRTERDLDGFFADLVAYHEQRAPAVAKVARLLFPALIERLDPVTTAGSMQVSVAFARERARQEGLDPNTVRERLYTRAGGVHYGTARLFAHEADYDKPIYRFADYNAGYYASRNAAFQTQLAAVVDQPLAPDGDVLAWNDRGKPRKEESSTLRALLAWRAEQAPDLSEARVRSDAAREKERAFESTATWARLRAAYTERTGKSPVYARVPDIALDSPKFSKELTTRWFAERVDRRYRECLQRPR